MKQNTDADVRDLTGPVELSEADTDRTSGGAPTLSVRKDLSGDNRSDRRDQESAVGSPNVTVNGGPLAFVAPLVSGRK